MNRSVKPSVTTLNLSMSSEFIAIIGCGKMGSAIMDGWITSDDGCAKDLTSDSFLAVVPSPENRKKLNERYGVSTFASTCDLIPFASDISTLVLAVKPQVLPDVLKDVKAILDAGASCCIVSIAAGITTDFISDALEGYDRVVRVMPNMPLQIGCGASALCGAQACPTKDLDHVLSMFNLLGYAALVDESNMDAVCAISGGGPAYIAKFVADLSASGVCAGLAPQVAEKLALQTLYGTAKLLEVGGYDPSSLEKAVCSPGGTTLAAISAMDEHGFDDAVAEGITAAIRRGEELAKC